MHRHRSSVMKAVMQPVIRENTVWGIPDVRYCNSTESNARSAVINAGVQQMLIQINVNRQPMSETAKPACKTLVRISENACMIQLQFSCIYNKPKKAVCKPQLQLLSRSVFYSYLIKLITTYHNMLCQKETGSIFKGSSQYVELQTVFHKSKTILCTGSGMKADG